MFTLNFSNGSLQTYPDYSSLYSAAKAMGGDVKLIRDKIYVFVPKK